ncbi:hypothetical protein GQ53DRAFT_186430 [Thozetella sp. PMI_491]|nr:hypothetical protein GQ53DRAFT_186430 [Thozetella sp. PMI_491]
MAELHSVYRIIADVVLRRRGLATPSLGPCAYDGCWRWRGCLSRRLQHFCFYRSELSSKKPTMGPYTFIRVLDYSLPEKNLPTIHRIPSS